MPLLHVTTLQPGNWAAAGGRGAAAPWGAGWFASRQPQEGGLLVGSSELRIPD